MIKNNLRHILLDKKKSLRALAREIDVNYSTLYYFTGDDIGSYSREILDKVCKALDVQPGDILVYVPDSP